jgi:hypothetical protein
VQLAMAEGFAGPPKTDWRMNRCRFSLSGKARMMSTAPHAFLPAEGDFSVKRSSVYTAATPFENARHSIVSASNRSHTNR